MSRSYYSCFQAGIHALPRNGVRPRGAQDQWGHDFVQVQFVGLLINRRKLYPANLRQTLFRNLSLRHEADYGPRRRRSSKHRGPCGDRASSSTPSLEGM